MPLKKTDQKLHIAVRNNDLSDAERLLKGGIIGFGKANPNEMDVSGYGALHYALSEAMVDLLCKYKANVELRDSDYDKGDQRPIHTAANAEVTRALRKHDANIKSTYKDSLNTALHVAKSADQVDAIVEGDGIDLVNQCNRYSQLPLDTVKDEETKQRIRHYGGKTRDEYEAERKGLVEAKKVESTHFKDNSDQIQI